MNVYKIDKIGELLASNPYPGRGIVVGKSEDGKYAVSAYFIMGRSENSRNRVFVKKDNVLYTEPYDASKVSDPSLIIYAAVREHNGALIVTNGDQTDTVYEAMKAGGDMRSALRTREFEPDAPNLTPRISAVSFIEEGELCYEMSILKSADPEGSSCNRFFYEYSSVAGVGHFIHTYVTDGNPIPTFVGEPERVLIPSDIDAFAKEIWENLNENNKISLYLRYTSLEDGSVSERIINKNA
ncbi:MAG: IMP cyclohydrolase [Clostridia bacterium]|nr:IMP cyclohydrolase [Clostridia bacterium]